jgi:serine/threonine-protein kinase
MPADPELSRRAFAVAERAFQEPEASRWAFVENACAGDEELLCAVEDLLAQDAVASSFLEEPLIRGWEEAAEQAWIGRHVGPYRLLRLLGAGGSSLVYLGAREEGELLHQVAIKLLRSTVLGPDAVRRFETERKVLASLDHPGIARFIDAGTTEEGVPYLVMEYVAGSSITSYCDEHRLTVRRRLRLFLEVCRAVQSAHQRLVIHRDIKPSNVLVTADGMPRLLDFGVSKLVGTSAEERDETATRDRLLTPSYASPEQLAGGLVTTASDVYSLGVVLYELLTGALPRPPGFAGSAVGEPRPSLTLTIDPAVAEARSVTTAVLRRQLAGDLDAIVVRALRDDPQERYASVEQLAEDLRRFLAGLPVDATAPRLVYRVRKFVGRNAAAVSATAVAGVALVALVISTLAQSSRLAVERDRARYERRRAEEVTRFLVRSFELADPNRSSSGATTAREVVERAARRVSAELAGQPDLEAEILSTLGAVYRGVGLYDESVRLLGRALDLSRARLKEEDPATGAILQELALSLGQTGDFASAETHAREALATHQGDDEATVADLGALVFALWGQGRLDEAEEAGRRALAVAAGVGDGDALQLIEAQTNLAVVLETQGRFEEAEWLYDQALGTLRHRYGEDHPLLVVTTNNLAWLLQQQGDFAAAEQRQREALELARRVFGERHPEVAINLNNLGLLMQRRGDYADAEALHREALALHRANLGEEHPSVARSLNNVALALTERGDQEGAAELYARAVKLFQRTLGEDHPEVATAASNLGTVLTQLGRFGEAELYLREALDIRRRRLGNDHLDVGSGCLALAKLLLAMNRPVEAQGLAEEALAIYTRRLAHGHWRITVSRGVLGASLAAQGQLAAAEPLLVAELEALSAARGEGSTTTRWQLQRLVDLYVAWGRNDEAARYRARLPP